MRNPSIGRNDYEQEREAGFRSLLAGNLRQQFSKYPFLHLSPEISGTDASNYWWNKRNFRGLAEQIARASGERVEDVRRQLASKVAILEYCPYRATRFDTRATHLPSAQLARAALGEALEEARQTQNRAFVLPWNPSVWEMGDYLNVPYVKNHRAQSFTFRQGVGSGFGELIARYAFA